MTTFENSGVESTISARPGIAGYMPIAANAYQDDIVPRSSLPGMPRVVVVQSVSRIWRTTSCVLAGLPAHTNSHGAHSEGSLLSSGCRPPSPVNAHAEPLWKYASSREAAASGPPIALKSPAMLNGMFHTYWVGLPSAKSGPPAGSNPGHVPSAARFCMKPAPVRWKMFCQYWARSMNCARVADVAQPRGEVGDREVCRRVLERLARPAPGVRRLGEVVLEQELVQ